MIGREPASGGAGPASRPTRTRTRAGRLAHLDPELAAEPWAPGDVVVDLGFGAAPDTTVELADALPAGVTVVGIERDAGAVARAARAARPGLAFEVGGFALARRGVALVRAMNVLRGYPAEACAPARAALGAALREGGLLVEGTCGPAGEVSVSGWWRRRGDGLAPERMVFATAFARGFAPLVFRDRLPRDLRGYRRDGPVAGLFADWTAAYAEAARAGREPRARFVASAEALAAARPDVPRRPEAWAAGRLAWAPADWR